MPLPKDQLAQAVAMAQWGKPTAPSHDPAAVQAQMLEGQIGIQRANDMSYRPPRRMAQMGWGSALTEALRPFVAKRNMKKANATLADALGKQGELAQHDAAMAEYQAGIADAKKRQKELEMYGMKKNVDQQYAPQAQLPEKAQLIEYLKTQPPETQALYAKYLGFTDDASKPKHGTATIGGNIYPTIDGVPQMDAPAYGPSDAAIKKQDADAAATQDRESGQRILAEKMRGFNDIITDDNFRSAVGPIDSGWTARTLGGMANTKDSQILRKIDRLGGMEVLDLGARVLKGSQTEGEWARVGETMPADKDHPEVWYSWYDDALKTLMAGAPEMSEQLEPLRKSLYDYAENSKWDRAGEYKPYNSGGTRKVGRFTVVEE